MMIGRKSATAAVAVGAAALVMAGGAVALTGLTYKVVAGRTASGSVGFSGRTNTGTQAAPDLTFTDTRTSVAIGCKSGAMHGGVTLGRTRTAQLGTITGSSASHCTAFSGYAALGYKHKGTWHLNGASRTAHGVTQVSLGAVTMVLSSSTCTFTAGGAADGTYSNSTKKLDLQPRTGSGHSLKASRVSGCGGVVKNGDKITVVGVFTLSTPKGALHIS